MIGRSLRPAAGAETPTIDRAALTGRVEGDLGILLIGSRVNRQLRPDRRLPGFRAMPKMGRKSLNPR